jgi:hypothetical protein
MEKLELKHLSAYLPYGLKIENQGNKLVRELVCELAHENHIQRKISIGLILGMAHINKPILRPLSDLNKDIVGVFYNDLQDDTLEHLINEITNGELPYMSWTFNTFLISKHFDVFGLIKKGLAIDINTLEL